MVCDEPLLGVVEHDAVGGQAQGELLRGERGGYAVAVGVDGDAEAAGGEHGLTDGAGVRPGGKWPEGRPLGFREQIQRPPSRGTVESHVGNGVAPVGQGRVAGLDAGRFATCEE